jgi:hypothetical protein
MGGRIMNAIAATTTELITDVLNEDNEKQAEKEITPSSLAEISVAESSVAEFNPQVLSNIYQEDINIAIWKRELSPELATAAALFIKENSVKPTRLTVSAEDAFDELCNTFGDSHAAVILNKDIALLVDMFCCLFDLKSIGLRLAILNTAMCPRFHVDRIPCRLITTYQGLGTQWLAHNVVDRTKLGAGNQGKSDEESGLFCGLDKMNSLNEGDVALLKGENWDDTNGFGLVHRSPLVPNGEKRLVLTLDFID